MLQGQDISLVDECNSVCSIFLEGVDRFHHWWDHVLVRDPIFVLLEVHSTLLDDALVDVNQVMVVHWVACSAGIGSADEGAPCEGLETFGGMPGGGHSLPIFLAIFGHGTLVLCDETVKHVEKDNVWLLLVDWLVW
jgi:hypothetical protein